MTKNINQNDIKTVTNKAEIEKSISKEGTNDIETKNDSSEASLIISIKTGKKLQYIIFILGLVVIVAISIYEINKRVLKE